MTQPKALEAAPAAGGPELSHLLTIHCLPAVSPECTYSFVCMEICSQGWSTDFPGFLRLLEVGLKAEVALPDPRHTARLGLTWAGSSPLLWPVDC